MKIFFTYSFLLFSLTFCYGQSVLHSSEGKGSPLVKGIIANYANQPLHLYKLYGDTLFLVDSTNTGNNGEFVFANEAKGMYKIALQKKQFFFILNNGKPIEIKASFHPSKFENNIAANDITVLKSEENKQLYEFQRLQNQLNVANYFLIQMMRLYPLTDPYHEQIENEYFHRYKAMDEFIKNRMKAKQAAHDLSLKIALAYYQPVNPDWKQPDTWRDSIIAQHYFDYFNPADSFYLQTNILPEKMDIYMSLKTNKRDAFNQPINDEMIAAFAAKEFLDKTRINSQNFEFCFSYLLEGFKKQHLDSSFLYLYDTYTKPQSENCETSFAISEPIKEQADRLRDIRTGSVAPDFEIGENLRLSSINSEYTLLLFWASWCPYCTEEVPEVKEVVNDFNSEHINKGKLLTVAISLDTDKEQWQKFVNENNLFSFLNFSELKGWKSEVVKKYNVYATPTMFLLDKDKKIIAKPETIQQLKNNLSTLFADTSKMTRE